MPIYSIFSVLCEHKSLQKNCLLGLICPLDLDGKNILFNAEDSPQTAA